MNVFSVALLCFLLGVLRATASRDARRVAGRDFGKTSRDKKVRYSLDTSAMGHSSDAGRGYCRFPSPAPQRECDECFACRECSQCPDCPDCAICPPLEPVSATCIDGASTSCCSPSAANEGLFLFPDRCPEDWTDPAEVCAQLSLQLPAGATLVPDGSATTNGATYTPTKAAALLAIGNSRLCYSLHPNAMTGPVFTSCDYDGQEYNPNMFSLGIVVTGYSLVVGGDLILSSPDQTPSVPIRATDNVAVWGDLVIGRMQFNDPLSPLPWQINTSAMSMGVFTLGGNVIATPSASISILSEMVRLGNAANAVYFDATDVSPIDDPSTERATLNGHICDATAQIEIGATAPDGMAEVNASGELTIVCTGGGVLGYQSLTCIGCGYIMFAFTDAAEITVNVMSGPNQVFPIFAPVCDHVNIIYPPNVGDVATLNTGIATGIGCNLYIYYNNEIGIFGPSNFINWGVFPIPDTNQPVAIYCQCACDPDTFNVDTVATQCTPV
eukprot:Selendium_serpulae@DN6518_c2_g1_i6.p1